MQEFDVPLFGVGLFRNAFGNQIVEDLRTHAGDIFRYVFDSHQFLALFVDNFALVVHNVIELQQVFANFEVARLDLLLGFFQRFVDPRMDDGFAVFKA